MKPPISFCFAPREVATQMGMTEDKFKEHANFLLLRTANLWTMNPEKPTRFYLFFDTPNNELERHVHNARWTFLNLWRAAKDHVVSHENATGVHSFAATIRVEGNPLGLYSIYPKPLDGVNPIEFIIEEA